MTKPNAVVYYRNVRGLSLEALEATVNELIAEGWHCLGGITAHRTPDILSGGVVIYGSLTWFQTMARPFTPDTPQ